MIALPSTPTFRLDGRRALVTGAGRSIGLAAAAALAEAGAHVVLVARTSDEIDQAATLIRERGGSAEAWCLDVTDIAAVRTVLEDQPAFHILVSNAGTNRPMPFVEVGADDFDAIVGLNLRAAFFVAQAVAARMIRDGQAGSIIHISSQMGHVGAANRTVYCASKAAIEGLSKAMAVELAPYGIRVNTVCPTFIETAMTASYLADEAFRSGVLGKIKLGRLGRVEDLMGAVTFLAGDASALMTGSSVMVDGGWTAE